MKTISFTLAFFAIAGIASAGTLRSEIEAMNKSVNKFLMKKDIDGFAKAVKGGVTKDFKYMENGKAMDFDTMVAGMKAGMGPEVKMVSSTTKVLSVTEKGKTGSSKMVSMMAMNQTGPDKKVHKVTFSGTSTSTYRMEGGKWKMASMTWGKQTMMMDGKPFDPSKMAAPSKSK